MKLLARTNIYYITFSVLTWCVVTLSFYLVVNNLIYKEVDERLIVERRDFEHFVATTGYWEESCYFVEDKISLKKTSGPDFTPAFKDTLMSNRYNNELVPFREYTFPNRIGNNDYIVSIRKSLIESNQLLKYIMLVMVVVLGIGLSLLFLLQRRVSKRIWQPFYITLSKAKTFDVNEGKGLTLANEEIFEFNELNSSLTKMTDKIAADYRNLKEFTENASHEIQTPLALINSRVEGLIQSKEIPGHTMNWIQDIHESTMRLSKLNWALLLLAKIDNGQFHDSEQLDLGEVVDGRIADMEEMFNLKGITVSINREGRFEVVINKSLAETMISNLLNNAMRHNLQQDGQIRITVGTNRLVIANTGSALTIPPEQLFERFRKQNPASASLGLGLAIVKKIATAYNLNVDYKYESGWHSIAITT